MITRFLLLPTLLSTILGLHAQDVVLVTNLNNAGDGSLRNAVATAFSGDTIRFTITGTIFITSGSITYNKDLVIDGPGQELLLIDGNDQFAPLVVSGGSTWMDDLTIIHGNNQNPSSAGGGMYFHGDSLTMTRVRITLCKQSSAPEYDGGGGLYANALKARITECSFDANFLNPEPQDSGGAKGGGAYVYCPDIRFIDCRITGNIARGSPSAEGGGLWIGGGGHLINCRVDSNQVIGVYTGNDPSAAAVGFGGGIDLNGNLSIIGGSVSNNIASTLSGSYSQHRGGGIFCGVFSRLDLEGVALNNNSLPSNWIPLQQSHGGGIYLWRSALRLRNCLLDGNTASGGSGIYCSFQSTDGASSVSLSHTRITNGNSLPVLGAITLYRARNVRLTDCEVSSNSSAGLWTSQCDSLLVDRTLFAENQSGGAYIEHAATNATSFTNCTFEHNRAVSGAGLNAINVPLTTLRNCTFMNDTITGAFIAGREVHMQNSAVTMHNTILAANALQPIGAINLESSSAYSEGGNICSDNSGGDFMTQPNDLNNAEPQLGSFGDHGGFTRTWSLPSSSVCINLGGPDTLSVDQRGFLRDGLSDAGAYEYDAIDPQIQLIGASTDAVICMNALLSVSVQAESSGVIQYQWSKDGIEIPGATSAIYTTTATVGDAGAYTCDLNTTSDAITVGPIHIVVDICARVGDSDSDELHLWPQPVEDVLFISTTGTGMASLRLIDTLGRLVHARQVNGALNVDLSVAGIPPGSYALIVTDSRGASRTARVLKQ